MIRKHTILILLLIIGLLSLGGNAYSQSEDRFVYLPLIQNRFSGVDQPGGSTTATPIVTETIDASATGTPVPPTLEPSVTASATETDTPTERPTELPTLTSIATATPSSTASATPLPTETETPTPAPSQTPTATTVPTVTPTLPPFANRYRLTYQIDRSALPPLTYNVVTLNILVGEASILNVSAGGSDLPYQYAAASGLLTVTTDRSDLVIELYSDSQIAGFGTVTVAPLKENKAWAWSIGFDDNVGLEPMIDQFEPYGDWRGTLFLIGEIIRDDRNEPWWITDTDLIREHLADGWAIGSHSWGSHCNDANYESVKQGFDRLQAVVDGSSRPDYKITAFASPCFVDEYHPIILQMRGSGDSDVLFDETGDGYLIQVDGTETYVADGRNAVPFDFDRKIGRDSSVDVGDFNETKAIFDWLSAHAAPDRHMWYNSLAHGDKEDEVAAVLQYLYNTYGPNGSDEVWMAPSDQIYSYQVVRDKVDVTLIDVDLVNE